MKFFKKNVFTSGLRGAYFNYVAIKIFTCRYVQPLIKAKKSRQHFSFVFISIFHVSFFSSDHDFKVKISAKLCNDENAFRLVLAGFSFRLVSHMEKTYRNEVIFVVNLNYSVCLRLKFTCVSESMRFCCICRYIKLITFKTILVLQQKICVSIDTSVMQVNV